MTLDDDILDGLRFKDISQRHSGEVECNGLPPKRAGMRLEVKGHIFPKVWDIAVSIRKLREQRRIVNIGSGTVGVPIYEVILPEGTQKEGIYFVTPEGIKLYWHPGDHYEIGYLISELDVDLLAEKHFKR